MKLAAASFLPNAKSRLLPASIPFRFFAAAVAFHIAAWAVLAIGAEDAPEFRGGPGLPLAALHLLTLGVMTMTAMGAAFQLLPVATKQPIRWVWATQLAAWLFVPGVALLAIGMARTALLTMSLGALLTFGGLAVFAVILADNLRRASGLGVVAAHGWAALASLAALAGLGLLLVGDFGAALLADHARAALAHAVIAVYGFMGLLAIGFSHVLVPMFALSPAPPSAQGYSALGAAAIAIVVAAVGALAASDALLALAAAIGLAAAGLHVWTFAAVMRARMRKRLGLSFVLVRGAWACLPLSLAAGLALALGIEPPGGVTLFGFIALFGWLLTFLLGILQRIMPFLGSMHATKAGGRPPLVSQLTPERPLRLHAACHGAALALVALGIVVGSPAILRAGALIGLVGALAFGWFALGVIQRVMAHRAPPPAAPEPAR